MPPSHDRPSLVRQALHMFSARGARFLSAAVAFYALLSAAPLFVIVLGLVASVFGRARAEGALWEGLGRWIAPEGIAAARALTERLVTVEHSGGLLEVALVVYGSTRLFRALRRAINQLWGIDLEAIEGARARPERYARRYGQALLLTGLLAALVASLVVVKSASAVLGSLGASELPRVLWALDLSASVALTFLLFLLLIRVMPERPVPWRVAAAGALVSAALFAVGSGLVTLYLRHKHVADLYGGASAVVLVVLWVYYSAQVFFLGACFAGALCEREAGYV